MDSMRTATGDQRGSKRIREDSKRIRKDSRRTARA
jgi:hypothetical protein